MLVFFNNRGRWWKVISLSWLMIYSNGTIIGTIITFILKVPSPESVKQLRPIGLCNISYKIITKAMTTRIKSVMRELIGPHQSSFVLERQIMDNILTYQETLNSLRRKSRHQRWMIIKIHLEKAYDRLEWSYVQSTLEATCFNEDSVRNIAARISTSKLAVRLNGKVWEWFTPSRGIRQGDPISPLFFVLCIERLSHLIEEEISAGRWKGIKVTRSGPTVLYLFFANDMLLFGEATMQQATTMKQCLDQFCSQSGQKEFLEIIYLFLTQYPNINSAKHFSVPWYS